MAVTNFQQTIWSKSILKALDTITSLRNHCDFKYEKDSKNAKEVKIVGGNCYVRSAPNTNTGKVLGAAHEGDIFKFQSQISENGWHLIEYKNRNGWVSGKYSELVEK